ncbi:leupaxin isoform X1 [Nothobranchius furzeri]|uniref:Leupaxin-like n=2 Tax=Nothobranchius furzeri TaxID=105023 RepID=A0A8C6Q4V5_NOTFU|nr:leupaxin isoform X1 [Nothobranchius furzeri]KAF7203059.1 transcript variant X2 [Nothobranchius furzeri]
MQGKKNSKGSTGFNFTKNNLVASVTKMQQQHTDTFSSCVPRTGTDMDELDLLLEELALNTSAAASTQGNRNKDTSDVSGAFCAGLCRNENSPFVTNAYSDLPAPVPAALELDSPTQELDSILKGLVGLAEKEQELLTTPPSPPLTQRKVLNEIPEDGKPEKKDENCSPPSGSGAAASTQKKITDSIDDLLGGLSSDLEKIGVRTTVKGHCAACNKGIVGKMITALGEVWHPEHFVCEVCKKELGTIGFFEREGRPFCDKDYHELFSPRCAYCKRPIMQNILTALDQTWHPEHFFCTHCGDLFGQEGFLEKDGKPYCYKDFYHLFAPKCSGCGDSVRENYLTAANGTWHPECFVCADCLKPFSDGCFMELNGRVLCSLHFHSRQGTLCGHCCKPITGRCVSALDRKFHPEHFVCAFCLRQLSQGIFKEQQGKPYCAVCFNKLFL